MTKNKVLFWAWLPVVLWTGVIALESFFGSGGNTQSLLKAVLWRIFGDIPEATIDRVHFLARKTGHFIGYGIFALLWFRAFAATFPNRSRLLAAALAFTCTVATASLDEWHQSFSPERGGRAADVMLDGAGALALLIAGMVTIRRPRPLPNCG